MGVTISGDITGYPQLVCDDGARYTVLGVGRVGSYASAKRAGRCRARRYWAVVRWNDNQMSSQSLAKVGWEEFGQPHFKTKAQAIEHMIGPFVAELAKC